MEHQKSNNSNLHAAALCGLRKERQRELLLGADALASMHDFVVTMMMYVQYIIYAVAGGFAVIAAFQIYIKMNTGEDGITKHILTLVGACLFIIGASIVFPAFFGYRI